MKGGGNGTPNQRFVSLRSKSTEMASLSELPTNGVCAVPHSRLKSLCCCFCSIDGADVREDSAQVI